MSDKHRVLAEEYAAKILKHITDSYYPHNVWFTNVMPIFEEFAEKVSNVKRD